MGQYLFGTHDDIDWNWVACCVVVLWGEVEEMEHQGLVIEYRGTSTFRDSSKSIDIFPQFTQHQLISEGINRFLENFMKLEPETQCC